MCPNDPEVTKDTRTHGKLIFVFLLHACFHWSLLWFRAQTEQSSWNKILKQVFSINLIYFILETKTCTATNELQRERIVFSIKNWAGTGEIRFIASSNTCCWYYARHSNIFRDIPHTADRGKKNKAHGLFSNCLSKQFFRGYLSKFQNNFSNINGKDFFFFLWFGLERGKKRKENKLYFHMCIN